MQPKSDSAEPVPEAAEGLDAVIATCQHVVHTTLSLMYWAAAAQRELVQQGRVLPVQTGAVDPESQWAQGLISAVSFIQSYFPDIQNRM